MSGYVRVDTEGIRRGGESFDQLGGQVDAIVARLNGGLASVGNCWGADKNGKAFEAKYIPARDEIIQAVTKLGATFGGVGDQVEQWAADYEATEEGATEIAAALAGEQPQ